MLVAPRARHLSQSFSALINDVNIKELTTTFDELTHRGSEALKLEGISTEEMEIYLSVDVRYKGQSYTLNIPWQGIQNTSENFHKNHQQRYGHRLDQSIELVTVRVKVQGNSDVIDNFQDQLLKTSANITPTFTEATLYGVDQPVKVYSREDLPQGIELKGPLLITEKVSTTFVDKEWQCRVDGVGNLLLRRVG
jgi:N-methylhydantoinase A